MKLNIKLISMFLAAIMLCGSLSCFSAVTVFAADMTSGSQSGTSKKEAVDYTSLIYANPDEKIADMEYMTKTGDYEMYAHRVTGEVAVKNVKTGQVLFTNPYDLASSKGSASTKNELMSQLIVTYVDNGNEKVFTSYEMAALRDQINVRNIKHGIRVEYTIGREETRRLVPRQIVDSSFQTNILEPMLAYFDGDTENYYYQKFVQYYLPKRLSDCVSDKQKKELLDAFPITEKYDIWVFDDETAGKETALNYCEEQIKACCPNYGFEEMDLDHQLTEYVAEDENPPVFKMALEYTLDKDGLSVRLPANGIRFNESLYQLSNIMVLPYMGAGNSNYSGYTFYPDGSGALFSFEDLDIASVTTINSKVYGTDYAYQKLTGTYQETVRYPVFGVVEDTEYYEYSLFEDDENPVRLNGVVNELVEQVAVSNNKNPALKKYEDAIKDADMEVIKESNGYVAVIEEGDALAEIQTYHAGMTGDYNSIRMLFNPRPSDSYNLADSISVGSNSEWTVVSARKYVGNYKIRYTMLTDDNLAAEKNLPDGSYYSATWLGMAFAYRDYLEKSGKLSRLSEEDVDSDIPLYIESFGALEATEKILSIPVDVMKPLTSFQDVKTMYEELAGKGVSNINFKLTGYSKGGMYSSIPNKVDWENVVEKDVDFQELLNYAAGLENGNLGLFPDFDFSYASTNTLFDGLVMRRHVVKTIDDRYASRREYSPTMQKYLSYFQLAVSPAYFDVFYEKLAADYEKQYENLVGMSVGSLGNALNSDFDDDDPYNREDSKGFVIKALDYLSGLQDGNMEIMVDGGNAYTWPYVDHVLGVSLDSSRYIKASYSVPFIGVVLHGYVNFTGEPLNMEGDVSYAMLKAIENGASIYFTLSYRNTQELKDYYLLSQYYSIRYDIWKDDVVEIYNELNAELNDVQDKLIINHEFLDGNRVADVDELATDIRNEFNSVLEYQQNKAEHEKMEVLQAMANARENIANVETLAETLVKERLGLYSSARGAATYYATGENSFYNALLAYVNAQNEWERVLAVREAAVDATAEEKEMLDAACATAESVCNSAYNQLKKTIRLVERALGQLQEQYNELQVLWQLATGEKGAVLINGTTECPESIKKEIKEQLENTQALMEEVLGININRSVEKLAMDTFLYTHVANLFTDIVETAGASSVGDLAQLTYEVLTAGEVGLTNSKEDLDLLRYFKANKDLTDEQLVAKYGIGDTKSMDAVVAFVKEMLTGVEMTADSFDETVKAAFDPAMTAEEIDDAIVSYYRYILFNEAMKLYTLELKQLTTRSKGISAVESAVKNQIKNLGSSSNLKDIVDDEKMADIVKAVEDALNTALKDTDVVYETSESNRELIKNYFIATYYQTYYKDMRTGCLDKLESKLLTNNTTTASSLKLLYQDRYEADVKAGADEDKADWYVSKLTSILESEEFRASIESMAAHVTVSGYGEIADKLVAGFEVLYANGVLSVNKKTPTFNFTDKSNEAVAIEALTEAVAGATAVTDLYEIVAQVAEDMVACEYKEGKDMAQDLLCYAAYLYYQKVSASGYTATYYYNQYMGEMDAMVQAQVQEWVDSIRSEITEGETKYQVWDRILATLANSENPLSEFVTAAAGVLSEYEDVATLTDSIQQYVCYLLFGAFDDEYALGSVPTLNVLLSDEDDDGAGKELVAVIRTSVQTWAKSLVSSVKKNTARGQMPNYAMSVVFSEEELDAKAREYARYAGFSADDDQYDTLVAELKEYICYWYYREVKVERLAADKMPTFSVSDLYRNLYTIADGEKASAGAIEDVVALMEYYALCFLDDMTKEDLEAMRSKTQKTTEEEVEEFSKYSSDKGKLVAVTYGDKNADGTLAAYKTFVLNYNDFSVRVTYNGVLYTIPAYGYISLYV